MGNICRSPTAEGFFRHYLREKGLQNVISTDSAGTHGYHVGHPPDARAIRAATRWGVDISDLKARRLAPTDFEAFDLVLAMDQANLDALRHQKSLAGSSKTKVALMMDFASNFGDVREVPDPYYGESAGFDYMCKLLDDATRGLLAQLESRIGDRGGEGQG